MPGNSAGGGGGGGRAGVDGAQGRFAGWWCRRQPYGMNEFYGTAGSKYWRINLYRTKVIDWWKTSLYSANVASPGNNTNHYGFMAVTSNGGDGGNGGNGSNGETNGAAGGGGGGYTAEVVPVVTEQFSHRNIKSYTNSS